MLVELQGVTYRYPSSSSPALKDVTLKAERGEYILLAGPSGCGKSTLARVLNGLIPNFYGGILEGEVLVDGKDPRETPTYMMALSVGFVFQNPENQLFFSDVEREIAFGLENLGMPPEEIRERVERVIAEYGLEEIRHLSPSELSGGQKQKVAIASVMAMEPKLLILDEPTANLDPFSAVKVLGLVKKEVLTRNITAIVIEHRLELVLPYVDRVVVMEKGRIIGDGDPYEVITEHSDVVGLPSIFDVYRRLTSRGLRLDNWPRTPEELATAIAAAVRKYQAR